MYGIVHHVRRAWHAVQRKEEDLNDASDLTAWLNDYTLLFKRISEITMEMNGHVCEWKRDNEMHRE